jgi:hypothetical protein
MSIKNTFSISAAGILIAAGLIIGTPAHADKAGAFLGGMVTAKVLNNMDRRTKAEEYQAYSTPRAQPVQQAAPASSGQSTQQKLDELDKLAAGGYITPEEYKAKKKAILDSM